jgi:DNA-directed RNA polymerase II subunit RPB9
MRTHGRTWQADLHFCADCNNLLYPKADPGRRQMVYACRICEYDEEVENKCVYKNDLLTVTKCV